MKKIKLPGAHPGKIEFFEREYESAVADAHGQPRGQAYTYNTLTGDFEFSYDVDEQVVVGLYNGFVHDPLWHRPEDKRFLQLSDKEDVGTLTGPERAELEKLTRKVVARRIREGS